MSAVSSASLPCPFWVVCARSSPRRPPSRGTYVCADDICGDAWAAGPWRNRGTSLGHGCRFADRGPPNGTAGVSECAILSPPIRPGPAGLVFISAPRPSAGLGPFASGGGLKPTPPSDRANIRGNRTMSVLREILVPAAAVAAAVAIILAIVVLMGRPENPPAPPDPEQPALDVDAAPPPDAIQRAAALRNRAETRTATLAGSQARSSETATVAAPLTKVDTPRQHEGSPVRSDAAAQAPAPFTTTGASPDERRVSRSGESAGAPKALGPVQQTYVAKGGDTPASIAREHLGDALPGSTDIARANPGLDARSLQVGQILNLPTGTAPR